MITLDYEVMDGSNLPPGIHNSVTGEHVHLLYFVWISMLFSLVSENSSNSRIMFRSFVPFDDYPPCRPNTRFPLEATW